ncbi:hypothetical protein [Pseudomonas inefficax]|uniref:hypothetical protein n=1 Tax=Pseudomonas inefficax TaxID=2078786 RepID=UPI0035C6383C
MSNVQWRVLPTLANKEMEQAGADAAREYLERNGHNNLWVIYEAMTAAAPKAPASTEPVECAICRDLGDQCMGCEEADFVTWADRHFAAADYRKTAAGVYIHDWMRHSFAAWQARGNLERKP